jgi:hypothetical protein
LRLGRYPWRHLTVGGHGTRYCIRDGRRFHQARRLLGLRGRLLRTLAQRRVRLTGGTRRRRTQTRRCAVAAIRRGAGVRHRRLPSSVKCIGNADEPFPAPNGRTFHRRCPVKQQKRPGFVNCRPVRSKYGERVVWR